MGLDIYFYERHWLRPQQNKKGNLIKPSFTIPTEMYGKGRKRFEHVSYIVCFVGYFRKANAIHKYMVDKAGYDDDVEFTNGRDLRILKSDILELKEICLELLGLQGKKFKEKAKELLPTAEGFFWGSTEYNKWYREDLRNFVKMVNKLHLDDPDVDVIYNADW